MSARSFLATVLVAVLTAASAHGQCVSRSALRTRHAEPPPPALGNGVPYASQNRLFADGEFDFSGYTCTARDKSPALSYSENTSYNLFGSNFFLGHASLASAGNWAFIMLYLDSPTSSVTLGASIGTRGFAAVMPAVSPRSEAFNVGTMQLGFSTLSIRPTITFTMDPQTNFVATVATRSVNLQVRTGVETNLAYQQRVFLFGLPVDAVLTGKIQDVFVNGSSNASTSATSAATSANFTLADGGSNLDFHVNMMTFPLYAASWSRAAGSLPTVSW